MKRKIIFAVLAVIVVAALVGMYLYTKQTPDIVQDKPDVVVKATDLIAAFQQDTTAARQKYLDKVVEVSGTIKKIDSASSITLGAEGSPSDVVVSLDRRHSKDSEGLKIGAEVVMQGKCTAYKTSSNGDPTDLLSALGTTVQLNFGGVKSAQ